MSKFPIAPAIAAAALTQRQKNAGTPLFLPLPEEGPMPTAGRLGADRIAAIESDARVEIRMVSGPVAALPREEREAIAGHDQLNDALYFEDRHPDDVVGLRIALDGTVILYVGA